MELDWLAAEGGGSKTNKQRSREQCLGIHPDELNGSEF